MSTNDNDIPKGYTPNSPEQMKELGDLSQKVFELVVAEMAADGVALLVVKDGRVMTSFAALDPQSLALIGAQGPDSIKTAFERMLRGNAGITMVKRS